MAYVIDVDRLIVMQRFDTMGEAEDYLENAPNCFIVENVGDIVSLLTADEMVKLYAKLSGVSLARFSNKLRGAKRLLDEMGRIDFDGRHKIFTAEDKARRVFEMYFDKTLVTRRHIEDLFCTVGVSAAKTAGLYDKFAHKFRSA